MTNETIVFCAFVVWITGGVLAVIFSDFEHELSEYIWWPLLLAKAALKGLYLVLFTGWRQ